MDWTNAKERDAEETADYTSLLQIFRRAKKRRFERSREGFANPDPGSLEDASPVTSEELQWQVPPTPRAGEVELTDADAKRSRTRADHTDARGVPGPATPHGLPNDGAPSPVTPCESPYWISVPHELISDFMKKQVEDYYSDWPAPRGRWL